MKRTGTFWSLLTTTAFCMGLHAQVNITADLTQRGIEISPTLYGIFYEDINHASDGGLYAELIRNRSFEYDAEKPEYWTPKGCSISLTTEGLLNDKQRHALRLETTEHFGGISNPGYWGINAVSGTQYRLSFWIKPVKGKPGTIKAALTDKDGKVLGESTIDKRLGKGWQKIETTLTATESDGQALFRLSMQNPCTVLLDVVSLFPPTFKGRKNGLRIDLAEKLQALHPAFVRFPGGCYVEGNHKPENAYHWERTVGPIEQRPGHMNANWGYPTTDGLGFHEFLQLCEDLNAKPLYVVNIGIWHGGCTPLDSLQPWIDECLGALEYANGPVTSHYGRMRAQNGHPEPFNIAYIEIGNENYNWHTEDNSDQSDHYPERYRMFYDAIKAQFPEVQCIGNVESWGTDTPKWRNSHPVDIIDEHYYRNPQWFVSQYHRFDSYDRSGPVIYPGEYAVTDGYGTTGNMNAAMGEAVFMIGMENNADIVRMSSYAPIFVNENSIQWRPDMIRFNSHQSFGTPSYWVQQMFSTHVGNRLVKTNLQWNIPQETPRNESPISVGLATWKTQSSYRNPQLIVEEANILPLSELDKWKQGNSDPKFRGIWSVEADSILKQTGNAEESMVVCPETFNAKRYTYKVQARKDSGSEGFMVVFNYIDEKNFDWFNVGGWSNTRSSVEQTWKGGRHNMGGGKSSHIDEGRWYDLQVNVDGDSLTCLIDGEVVFSGKKNNGQMYGVYANNTFDEKTQTLYTKVVNLCNRGTTGTLHLQGGTATTAEMVRLCSMTGEDENTMRYPNNIIPRPATIQKTENGKKLTFDVAPFSINIITTKLQ